MARRERLFTIPEEDIQRLLFADHSDEENLTLDEEDQSFLLEAVDNVTQEVIIEHPDPSSSTEPSSNTNLACTTLPVKPLFYGLPKHKCTLQTSAVNSEEGEQLPLLKKLQSSSKTQSVITGFDFRWKRGETKVITNTTEYDYGQVNLKLDDSAEIDALEVFERPSDFCTLDSLVVEQSELYMKQKGIPFQTNADEPSLEYVLLWGIMFCHRSETIGLLSQIFRYHL